MNLAQWKKSTLKNYIAKNKPPQEEVQHLLDFIKAHPQERLARASYPQLKVKSELWLKTIEKKTKSTQASGKVKTLMEFPDGFAIVELRDQISRNWESKHMGNCIARYKTKGKLFSLRDSQNIPHCSFEVHLNNIIQLSGQGNTPLAKRYVPYVINYFQLNKIKWRDSRSHWSLIPWIPISKEVLAEVNEFFNDLDIMQVEDLYFLNEVFSREKKDPIKTKNPKVFNFVLENDLSRNREKEIVPLISTGIKYSSKNKEHVISILKNEGYERVNLRSFNLLKTHFKKFSSIKVGSEFFITPNQNVGLKKKFKTASDSLLNFLFTSGLSQEGLEYLCSIKKIKSDMMVSFLRKCLNHGNVPAFLVFWNKLDTPLYDPEVLNLASHQGTAKLFIKLWNDFPKKSRNFTDCLAYAGASRNKEIMSFLFRQPEATAASLKTALHSLCTEFIAQSHTNSILEIQKEIDTLLKNKGK